MGNYFFTSESVCKGHPDKAADQVADAVLDAALSQDPDSRVSCEVLLSHNLIVLAGEISTKASLDYQVIARKTLEEIGYAEKDLGFDCRSSDVLLAIKQQSPDIARGVLRKEDLGAGDQGIMFGYASLETKELMPLPIMAANKIVLEIDQARVLKKLPYLRPDGKVQVTFEFNEKGEPIRLHAAVISVQHNEDVSQEEIQKDMKAIVAKILPPSFIDEKTYFYINPTGRFAIGGPAADCGMTGRKIMVDSYGGAARHGGGAFSGKDATKVDRSGAYAARYAAKNVVAAKLAAKCEVQIAYAIGIPTPVSIKVDTFGTGKVNDSDLSEALQKLCPFSLTRMIEAFDLKRPIYEKTAYGGHFGRPQFTWEKTDLVSTLNSYF
ncbi:MAG TPA: methionine adenosyltransferase [Parachlamydiaceae bacterium]|nr:methionine adenosyltransferase [Parachlamydiaceae bacterium]